MNRRRRRPKSIRKWFSNDILAVVIVFLFCILVFQQSRVPITPKPREFPLVRGGSRHGNLPVGDEFNLVMPKPFEDTLNVVLHISASSLQWHSSMGFTGESLQFQNILESLRVLNVSYFVVDYDLSHYGAFRAISSLAMEGTVERIDAIIMSGPERANFFAEHSHEEPFWKPSQLLLLDDFGRTSNYLNRKISPDHVLTWQPMHGNFFLGCFIDVSKYGIAPNIRENDGLVWGKHDMPFQIKRMLIDVSNKYTLHTTSSGTNIFEGFDASNIEIHGKMPRHRYLEFMSSFKFMIGIGDPLVAPSSLEALSMGLTLILPVFSKPRRIGGQIHRSQYDQLIFDIPVKYPDKAECVCGYKYGDSDSLISCIEKALSFKHLYPVANCKFPEFSKPAFVQRLKDALKATVLEDL